MKEQQTNSSILAPKPLGSLIISYLENTSNTAVAALSSRFTADAFLPSKSTLAVLEKMQVILYTEYHRTRHLQAHEYRHIHHIFCVYISASQKDNRTLVTRHYRLSILGFSHSKGQKNPIKTSYHYTVMKEKKKPHGSIQLTCK